MVAQDCMRGCEACTDGLTCNTCATGYHHWTDVDNTCHVATCLVSNCATCVNKELYPASA
jgi:hypothetical protein